MLRVLAFAAAALVGCSDESKSKVVDAPKAIDAQIATVVAVTCPATPAATIMTVETPAQAYDPTSVTIAVGQVVKFVMPGLHNVVPNPQESNPGIMVNFNETKCLMFTHAGTFNFHCAPHSFQGTVTVN